MKHISFLCILSLFSVPTNAWTPPESFNSTYIELEDSIFSATIKGHYRDAKSFLSTSVIESIFADEKNLIKPEFSVPKYYEPSVRFWFSIYTQYSSEQVVIHDSNNLSVVYNVIDFSELHESQGVHRFSKFKLQSQLSSEYTARVKKNLSKLSTIKFSKATAEQDDILNVLRNAGLKIPKAKKKRRAFFVNLAKSIRTQTGQRNKVYKGVVRSIPYLPFLKAQVKNFNLPEELLAIAFLESSFNPSAKSKVAAAGVWQFMPYIGNLIMPKMTKNMDYRNNPVISSLAAMHLLKENKMILKRWDLAVTAYNSGTKHLQKAIKKYSRFTKKSKIDLEYILKHYKHQHLGFASKNFYSEFLALVHVLAYKDMIYPTKGIQAKALFKDPKNLGIYVSKCAIRPSQFFKKLIKSSPKIVDINNHFEDLKYKYPRGSLVVSDKVLTKKRYYRLSDKEIRKRFPKFL